MKKLLLIVAILIIGIAATNEFKQSPAISFISDTFKKAQEKTKPTQNQLVVYEESVITKVIEDSLPSVVTIGISKTTRTRGSMQFDPFNPFSPFREIPSQEGQIEQNIGSGFIVSEDGLIITNKHVVLDSEAEYKVLTNDEKEYSVEKIYRDPLNDLAILKINAKNLKPLKMGNSSNIKLGQIAIAIGTPLGEFTNTVTTGIISGLGRGITAGSPYEGFVEKLDNVIQTDAAISPGNSGGPLLNSSGEIIGVNTAVALEGQNIGFAIPINVVKSLIESFNKQGGNFERPYLGISYEMIDRATAIRLEVAEGAYVQTVLEDSPAAKAGIEVDDIITQFDGKKIDDDDSESLTKSILNKKIGDTVKIRIWRDGEFIDTSVVVEGYSE